MPSVFILLIGFSAMACSFLYRIPQMYKIFKTRDVKSLSSSTIHIQNASYVLYILYAIEINDIVNIVSSAISMLQNFIILIMINKYSKTSEIVNNSRVNEVGDYIIEI